MILTNITYVQEEGEEEKKKKKKKKKIYWSNIAIIMV
jgi:hypothetical protein